MATTPITRTATEHQVNKSQVCDWPRNIRPFIPVENKHPVCCCSCGNFKYDPESVNAFGLKGERAPFAHGARCADRTAATYREHVRLKVCLECLDCILVPEDCTGNYWHQLDDLVQGNRHADSVIDAFPYLACHELLRVLDVAARLDSIDIEWTNDVFEYQACISLCSSPHRRFPSAVSFIKKQFDAFAQNVRTDSEIRARIGFDREGYMSLFCGAAKTYPRAFMSRPSTLRDAALLYAGTILPVEVLDIRDFTEALDALAVGPVPCVWIDRAEFNLDDHEEWSNAKDLFDRASLLDCLAKRFRFQDPEFIRTHHIRLLLFKNEGVDRSLLVRFKVCATVDDMPDEIEPRQQTFAQLADIYVDMDHADTYLVGKLEGALFDVPHLWVESRCAAGTKRVFSHMTLNANTVQSLNDNAPIARLVSEYKEAAGKGDRGPMHVVLCLRYSKRLCSNTLCYKFVETRRS